MSASLQTTIEQIETRQHQTGESSRHLWNLRPEHRLLLSCARTSLRSKDREDIREVLGRELDWEFLISEATRHGLMPLLYSHLDSTCREAIPEHRMKSLEDLFRRNALSNMLMSSEMFRVLDLLAQNDIPAIPLKGPTLAITVYEDLALRQFADVDILVQRNDVRRAGSLLIGNGYAPQLVLTSAQERACLKTDCEFTFRGQIYLELLWEIVPAAYCCRINRQRLWAGVDHVSMAGTSVRAVAPEDLLLILCVHGTKHAWERLGWILDVVELIRSRSEMEWERLFELARSLGCERMLLLGLALGNGLLSCELPKAVSQMIETDGKIKRLAGEVYQRLFDAGDRPSRVVRHSLFFVRSRERLRDRISCFLRMSLMPSVNDIRWLPLSSFTFPLYVVLRPLRLASNRISAGFDRLSSRRGR